VIAAEFHLEALELGAGDDARRAVDGLGVGQVSRSPPAVTRSSWSSETSELISTLERTERPQREQVGSTAWAARAGMTSTSSTDDDGVVAGE
jgi:hypothetical protein